MENLIRQAAEKLVSLELSKDSVSNLNRDTKNLIINNEGYESIPLTSENFYLIERKSSVKKFAFVDGGNQNIYSNSNISVDLIRIYYNIFKEEKKIKAQKYDFLLITKTTFDAKSKIIYSCELITKSGISLNKEHLIFDPKDDSLRNGIFECRINDIASKIRRFIELETARKIIDDELGLYDCIVLDGTLQNTIVYEDYYFNKLKCSSIEKSVLLCSVAKSSNIYTNSEKSYQDILIEMSKKIHMNRFVYYPAFIVNSNIHDAEIYFAKFHEASEIVLRVELLKEHAKFTDIMKFFSQLAFYCKDPIFLGYPYGLVDADKFARISNEEAQYFKIIFSSKSNKENIDLHSVLDKISF